MSMEAKGYKISKQHNHIQVTSRGIADEEWQEFEDLLEADIQEFCSDIPAEILANPNPCSLEDLERSPGVDAYHPDDAVPPLDLDDLEDLDKKFIEDNFIVGEPDPRLSAGWSLFANKQLLAYKNQSAAVRAKAKTQNTRQSATPRHSRQRGGSTRSSVKSGDGNEDGDPDPYDILVPDPIFLDPRVTTYGESPHKVSFRCIRKAILGCRIQDPTPRQKVAIDFYAAKFAQVCRALLRQNRFDPLTPTQRQDAESAIPAHLLKKMAANHNFEKMPNPNVKVIFNPNFRTINDVLHAAYPGSASENPTCPLEMYERIRHQGKVSFLPPIQNDDGDYIQAIDRIPTEESSYLSQEALIERAETEQEGKQELASELAFTGDGSRKKLNFGGDVLPLLCDLPETELRERLPAVVSLLPECGIKRSTARGVLETRAKDKFGKYPDREKCQQILEIFDQVPLQRKTGGAA
ncbi:hypothetical protein HF673_00065 [Acidithiobacillus thiooxidans]|uniref:hypothetical protein n=1 Tax=Acidithiobacillus thiooxidans TaxID=930 RepID=UPI001C06D682|nr:hypothetical protein [Acidithiobacillus thiooxidans]MBU2834211.1 hypothetical protein [Acidithiobacillus thiooxidans]